MQALFCKCFNHYSMTILVLPTTLKCQNLNFDIFQPFIQHRAHGFHDLPHHVRVREHLHKEVLILFITGSRHIGKVLLKEQHKGLAVIVLGIAVPLVLSGIIVFHLEQYLIHLSEVGAVLLVDLINDNRQWITLFLSAASLAGDGPEALRSAFQLDSTLEVLFQAVIFQQYLVIHIYLIPSALRQHGIEEFCVHTELVDVLIKQAADLRDKGINPVKPGQSGLEQILLFFLQRLKPIKRRADGSLELA